ncbi:MAG: tRNA dihydrouridine synthase DusB [Verrucomicrobia bacterium]|nr:tRNA dihydrouridine synthase DusB [Verrucomicrobiota bacterium]MCF7709285.1 tRNA dihydrouridine synthase DusB [Verrucomicrobiota bacterium]
MQIGGLEIESNLSLSPIAGYTNLPFRLALRRLGGLGLATTDLVNARSVLERNPKAFKLIETSPQDQPLAVQLFGAVKEVIRDAAILMESMGCPVIDINMGCPVRKVCKVGAGCAMMLDVKKSARMAAAVVDAVNIPVTVKMRLGWDREQVIAPELAKALEDAGISALTVHGRTRDQGFGGDVDLSGIRNTVNAVSGIPVIGNGDVVSPAAAKTMMDETGCAGVAIGRGAFYNPWIFYQTERFLETGVLPPGPSINDIIDFMRRHLDLLIEVFGETSACRMFRKITPWYARLFGPSKEFRKLTANLASRQEFETAISRYLEWRKEFIDEDGKLNNKYLPEPPVASFMRGGNDQSITPPVR